MATGHIRKRETLTGVSYQVIVETVAQESKTGKRARIYKSFEKKKRQRTI